MPKGVRTEKSLKKRLEQRGRRKARKRGVDTVSVKAAGLKPRLVSRN